MKKIFGYKIVFGETTPEIGQKVVEAMQKGWQPIGGATVAGKGLIQTLVLPEKAPMVKR